MNHFDFYTILQCLTYLVPFPRRLPAMPVLTVLVQQLKEQNNDVLINVYLTVTGIHVIITIKYNTDGGISVALLRQKPRTPGENPA